MEVLQNFYCNECSLHLIIDIVVTLPSKIKYPLCWAYTTIGEVQENNHSFQFARFKIGQLQHMENIA